MELSSLEGYFIYLSSTDLFLGEEDGVTLFKENPYIHICYYLEPNGHITQYLINEGIHLGVVRLVPFIWEWGGGTYELSHVDSLSLLDVLAVIENDPISVWV